MIQHTTLTHQETIMKWNLSELLKSVGQYVADMEELDWQLVDKPLLAVTTTPTGAFAMTLQFKCSGTLEVAEVK